MNTLKIETIWYQDGCTIVYVIDWDFDAWVEYGTFKVKGIHTHASILNMLMNGSDLLEHVGY